MGAPVGLYSSIHSSLASVVVPIQAISLRTTVIGGVCARPARAPQSPNAAASDTTSLERPATTSPPLLARRATVMVAHTQPRGEGSMKSVRGFVSVTRRPARIVLATIDTDRHM